MKKIIKRTLSVFLSFILAFSVFAILDYTPAITAEAANALNMQRRGGVQVVFSTSTSATQTDTYYIDPSSSSTYYLILINNSTQTATITGIANSSYVSGWPSSSFTIASGGRTYYILNKGSMSTSDLTKYDFTVTYALADVYESDGETLATFNQPAYIYILGTLRLICPISQRTAMTAVLQLLSATGLPDLKSGTIRNLTIVKR
ncbi:MAG: hypothetical protein LUG85_04460 [Clostridiales bacterium]|nr:hypothetical protein [Clostridiales bacterium]